MIEWEMFIPMAIFIAWVIFAIVFFVPRVMKSIRKDRADIRAYARSLGLSFQDGWESYQKTLQESSEPKAAMAIDRMPKVLRDLMEGATPWRIEGDWKGVRVVIKPEVHYGHDNSKSYIVAKAFYSQPLTFKLKASREGTLAKIGKAILGLKDVQIGDADFDPKVRVVADDETAAANVFYRQETAAAFLALLERFPDAVAESEGVVYARAGAKLRKEEIPEALDLLAAFAREVRT